MPHKPRENLAEISCLIQVDGESSARDAWKIAQKTGQRLLQRGFFQRYAEARTLRFSQRRLEASVTYENSQESRLHARFFRD